MKISEKLVVQSTERNREAWIEEDNHPQRPGRMKVRKFLAYEVEYRPGEGKELVTRVPYREVNWEEEGESHSFREPTDEATVVGHYRGHSSRLTGEPRKVLGPEDEVPEGMDYVVYEYLSAPD